MPDCSLGQSKVQLLVMYNNPTDSTRASAFPIILGVMAIVLGLDQLTKFLIRQNIQLYESWSFFPALARIFRLTFITNTGAAFGMFPQLGIAFTIIAIMVVISLLSFHHLLPIEILWIRLSLGLMLGGAMGNLLDRLIRGYVVDFIDIGFWPIFNLADLSVVTGVAILAYYLWDEPDQAEHISALPEGGNA